MSTAAHPRRCVCAACCERRLHERATRDPDATKRAIRSFGWKLTGYLTVPILVGLLVFGIVGAVIGCVLGLVCLLGSSRG